MPTKKRTSTKPQAAVRPNYVRAKHILFRDIFPWYGPSVVALHGTITQPPWFDNSPPMIELRRRANAEWTAMTGLPSLGTPGRWFTAAVAAGFGLPDVEQMQLDRLREIITQWALAKRAATDKTETRLGTDPPTVPSNGPTPPLPLLDPVDVEILKVLATTPGVAVFQTDLVANRRLNIDRKTAGKRLNYLRDIGYVAYPPHRSKADAITDAGLTRLKIMSASSP